MQKLGKLISVIKKVSHDFQFYDICKKSCMTYIMYSHNLNQIIAIKIPNRSHYISKELARIYLQSTRKSIEKILGESICKKSYVLNVLISNNLTKSCFELVAIDQDKKNLDMLFNIKKPSDEEKILSTIFKALSTKCQSWVLQIKNGCKNLNVEPFKDVKKKIQDIERAVDIFHYESLKSKRYK